jgi:hypothetical protein
MKQRRRLKVGLRNRTIAERYRIAAAFVDAVAQLPTTKQNKLRFSALQQAREAAESADTDVHRLTSALNEAVSRRKNTLATYCRRVSTSAQIADVMARREPEVFACSLSPERPKLPLPPPDAPSNFRSVPCDIEGAVKLRWKRPCRRCWFEMEMTTDPAAKTGWTRIQWLNSSCATAKILVTGLQPGVLYWFRVRAGASAGPSPWSDPLSVRPVR